MTNRCYFEEYDLQLSKARSDPRPRTSRRASNDSLLHLAKIESTLRELRASKTISTTTSAAGRRRRWAADKISQLSDRVAQPIHRVAYRLRQPTNPDLCSCRAGEACPECLGRKSLLREPLRVIHWVPGRGEPFFAEPHWIWADVEKK
ncbi:hypothetical protein PVAG01_06334 [Phlyctema vagabunda]|uniref:Uncharacterized protein n=1 Tax=Phlyctema vagabunda TaxID=108571 RepID=A0ABR4PFS2_9HELO